VYSPAKVNLSLHVMQRRDDGYHALSSRMQAISLFDTLTFKYPVHRPQYSCSSAELEMGERNLILRALRLFEAKHPQTPPLSIHLDKRIPMEAGLGGGSGNAASCLWALNEICGRPFSEKSLCRWGAELGSDVPFFFSSGHARCVGRGDVLCEASCPETIPRKGWIVRPPGPGLSTPEVYEAYRSLSHEEADFVNDLEGPAFALRPDLAEWKGLLESQGFSPVFLCGSGTALCALGHDREPDAEACAIFPFEYIQRDAGKWYEPIREGVLV
jgi:4-diphosphocytidyl-2-C-methyl-D-erythritol kinase